VRVLAVYGEAYLSYRTAAMVRTIRDERPRCTVLGISTGKLEALGRFEFDPDVSSRPATSTRTLYATRVKPGRLDKETILPHGAILEPHSSCQESNRG
jgi:hypothetical protein